MRGAKYTLDISTLKKLLSYDSVTGEFTRASPARGVNVGDKAGGVERDGYVRIRVFPYSYQAHILAWFYHYGEWPKNKIDHIDGNRSNNAINNLRLATQGENRQNLKKATAKSKSGFLGVVSQKGVFRAHICVNGERHYLGRYSTPEEAHAVYLEAKRRLHPFSTL